MDDDALVTAFQQTRDPIWFERLVLRHHGAVLRTVASVLGPGRGASEVEDVVQEAFVRAFDALPSFRRASRFGTWLYRIAYRRALDRRQLARNKAPHLSLAILESKPDPSASALDASLSNERQRQLWRALDRLPDLHRTAVHMHYWLEEPVAAIAETLDLPVGTVKSYLHRARQRLARSLDEEGATW